MAHDHGHGPAEPASAPVRRIIAAVLIPFALAVAIGMYLMWPHQHAHAASGIGFDQATANGTVTAARLAPCAGTSGGAGGGVSGSAGGGSGTDTTCSVLTVHITAGPGAGGYTQQIVGIDPATPRYSVGDDVVLTYQPGVPPSQAYTISDFQREFPMEVLAGIFAVLVVVVGRWRGLAALLALGVSFLVLVLFVLPALLAGSDALLAAVVGSAAIMLAVLYLTHGFSARTSVAVLGTLASLALIAALGTIFVSVAKLTGLGNEATAVIAPQYPQMDVRGLLLAGFVIGSLGVLNDVTVTQTSSVWELKHTNPKLGAGELYRSGMRIGRDHIASTVNTLVMAYVGASLPLVLLFSVSGRGATQVVTADVVAEDIVRALVGGIGLVASVPLTTALAAFVASRERSRGGAEAPAAVEGAAGGGVRSEPGPLPSPVAVPRQAYPPRPSGGPTAQPPPLTGTVAVVPPTEEDIRRGRHRR